MRGDPRYCSLPPTAARSHRGAVGPCSRPHAALGHGPSAGRLHPIGSPLPNLQMAPKKKLEPAAGQRSISAFFSAKPKVRRGSLVADQCPLYLGLRLMRS